MKASTIRTPASRRVGRGKQIVFVLERGQDRNAVAHAAFSSDGRLRAIAFRQVSSALDFGDGDDRSKRQNNRKQVKNSPKLPTSVAISIDVGA